MAPKLKFCEGEKVLCFHGPLIYAAKCLKVFVKKDRETKYLIHYAGWNKNWDEWVSEQSVLKYNEANCQKQKEVLRKHNQSMKIKKGTLKKKADSASVNKIIDQATTTTASKVKEGKDAQQKQSEKIQAVTEEPTPSTSSFQANSQDSTESQSSKSADGLRRKSARKENSVDIVVTPVVRSEIVLKISDKLKNFLITDYVYILKEKLPSVPARVSTTYILQNYAEYKTAQSLNSLERSILMDFIEGITQYFDTTLGTQLLYAPERVRYNDITQQNPSIPICELYGAIHLARMFLKMGSLLSYSVIRGEHLESISNHLKNLMDFFTDNLKCYVQPTDYC